MNKKVIIGIVGGVAAVAGVAAGVIINKKKKNGYVETTTQLHVVDDLPEEIDDSFFDEE